MGISKISPMLYTADLHGTVDFYVQQLGFSIANEDASRGWASVQRDGIELMMSLPNAYVRFDRPLFTGSFYFTLSNDDELWQTLKDKLRVCYKPADFDYGRREFAIYNNHVNLLQFRQEIAAAR